MELRFTELATPEPQHYGSIAADEFKEGSPRPPAMPSYRPLPIPSAPAFSMRAGYISSIT